jgi:hypothetical protein
MFSLMKWNIESCAREIVSIISWSSPPLLLLSILASDQHQHPCLSHLRLTLWDSNHLRYLYFKSNENRIGYFYTKHMLMCFMLISNWYKLRSKLMWSTLIYCYSDRMKWVNLRDITFLFFYYNSCLFYFILFHKTSSSYCILKTFTISFISSFLVTHLILIIFEWKMMRFILFFFLSCLLYYASCIM